MENLLSALAGAMIGVVATFGIYLMDRTRRERAAVRALLAEVNANALALDTLAKLLVSAPITNSMYLSQMPAVAARIDKEDLAALARAYFFVPACEVIRERVADEITLLPGDMGTLTTTADAFRAAGVALQRHA